MRWLPVLLLLLHSPTALSEEVRDTAAERLAMAVRLYRAGSHDKARATLIGLLNDPTVDDRDVRLSARVYLGEVLFVEGNRQAAWTTFQAILVDDPDLRLDPYEHPPSVVEFFDMVLAATLAMGPNDPPPPLPDPVPPPPELEPVHWTGYMPFGWHQYRERRPVRGTLLAVGQAGLLAGTFATGIPLYLDHEGEQGEYQDLQKMRAANWAMSGAFAALWITGTVEASVRWRKEHRNRLEAWEADHAHSQLMLTPTSVRWELRF